MRILCIAVVVILCSVVASVAQADSELPHVASAYTIAVSFSDYTVHVYDPLGNEIFLSEVAVPRFPIRLPAKGRVIAIERNPWWFPPPGVRSYVLDTEGVVLPERVPPGPNNPMGSVKLTFRFTSATNPLSKMHGTNNPRSIGKRATSGCIRLRNEDALALADLIEPLFKNGIEIKILYVKTLEGERVAVASRE